MNIAKLQQSMMNQEQVDCPVNHYFSDGIYARELIIPKGCCIVGAKHKTRHLFLVTKGHCLIADGDDVIEVQAPFTSETIEGTKRAITALEDTVIMTFHVTDETDIDKIGDEILEPENTLPQWKYKLIGGGS